MRIRNYAFSAVVVFDPDMSSFYRFRILSIIRRHSFNQEQRAFQGEQGSHRAVQQVYHTLPTEEVKHTHAEAG